MTYFGSREKYVMLISIFLMIKTGLPSAPVSLQLNISHCFPTRVGLKWLMVVHRSFLDSLQALVLGIRFTLARSRSLGMSMA